VCWGGALAGPPCDRAMLPPAAPAFAGSAAPLDADLAWLHRPAHSRAAARGAPAPRSHRANIKKALAAADVALAHAPAAAAATVVAAVPRLKAEQLSPPLSDEGVDHSDSDERRQRYGAMAGPGAAALAAVPAHAPPPVSGAAGVSEGSPAHYASPLATTATTSSDRSPDSHSGYVSDPAPEDMDVFLSVRALRAEERG
jgi:hypothetical protein